MSDRPAAYLAHCASTPVNVPCGCLDRTRRLAIDIEEVVERSVKASKLLNVTSSETEAFVKRMDKLRAQMQATRSDYQKAYLATMDKMMGGETQRSTTASSENKNSYE